MQTVLGSTGQIGTELARALRAHTDAVRLVSRNPKPVSPGDQCVAADLLDPEQTLHAVQGSSTVYLTAGLPMDTRRWVEQWPVLMANVIAACAAHDATLVFFDNTYMYPQTATPQTEATPFAPNGPQGLIRARIAQALLDAMAAGRVRGLIARAPEFYGPGATQSVTNALVVDKLWAKTPAQILVRDDTLRTLIYTPDASRALALLGNTPDTCGQTWHLPCDDNRLSYRDLVALAADVFGVPAAHQVRARWQLRLAGLFSQTARDLAELLPRYGADNLFVSDRFKARFPEFQVTPLRAGLEAIRDERRAA
ncbi:MAG: NAD-dependent epimerase/dehydratase family protein [Myxococcales bacterium]|nr:NAD-dependent epimerase/dehydratase family protein [Myxococcales bacterium]MCB9525404.1 NAD-dependent epimerase/dehydratase family protein [Myxococcales bacterium]